MNLRTTHRVFDIETVVDRRLWTPPKPRYELVEHARFQGDAGARLVDPFPPPQACRIVAINWIDLGCDEDAGLWFNFKSSRASCSWARGANPELADPFQSELSEADRVERNVLLQFHDAVSDDLHSGAGIPTFVSWNGRGFDFPVIVMRSLFHKIPMPWYYQNRDVRYRYTEAGHCDLMDVFSDYGACRNISMSDSARTIGLPGKEDTKGSDVATLVAAGYFASDWEKVSRYCTSDVAQTALLFIRSRFHEGIITAAQHDAAAASFGSSEDLRVARFAHMNLFIDKTVEIHR